jgi:catechol 2,3-dioxygenase-like lactoylglutathione lyase family enzyme
MIEHISLPVSNFARAKAFYLEALEPLGYRLNMDFEGAAGFMEGGHTSFWIVEKPKIIDIHVAFLAKNKDAVHAFYDAAMKAGATDHGAPGPRREYSPDYYAAFVLDRDGHNIEAVYYDETAV